MTLPTYNPLPSFQPKGAKSGGCLIAVLTGLSYLAAIIVISGKLIADFDSSGAICTSSTAGLAYMFIPIWSTVPALPFALVAFTVLSLLRSRNPGVPPRRIVTTIATVMSLTYLGFIGLHLSNHIRLVNLVQQVRVMDDAGVSEILESNPYAEDRNVLSAIAMNHSTGPSNLNRIAQLDNPQIHDRQYSRRNHSILDFLLTGWFYASGEKQRSLEGDNYHWQHSVHELISLHPNASSETLALLADCPNSFTVANVAMNPKTSPDILETIYGNRDSRVEYLTFRQELCERPSRINASYVIKLRLAENPALPELILKDMLNGSTDYCLAELVAGNPDVSPTVQAQICEVVAQGRKGCSNYSPPGWLSTGTRERGVLEYEFCDF